MDAEDEMKDEPPEEEIEEPPEEEIEEEDKPAPPSPWTPAMAARYERREKLGEGMFGEVYKAWDRVEGRFVAVKRLPGRGGGGFVATRLHDFARQAMSLGACRAHPSVVALLATYANTTRRDGDCFLVTEYAGPMNLRQYMNARHINGQPFLEGEVREAVRGLLDGAGRAHGAGVLHRDIVPENVVVDQVRDDEEEPRMVYRICGFSEAEPAALPEKDGSGMLASSSAYRAPELFFGSGDYDGRVDTWSIGCVMAELLAGTGEPFFAGASQAEVICKMMHVVGAKGVVKWPGLERVAAPDQAAFLRERCGRDRGHLRQAFPRKVLSHAGFEVLKGLLQSNPERRLTAAAALRMPWFQRRRRFGGCFVPSGGGDV